MDTLKAIHVFIEVSKTQSFTQAAEQLNISRAMASRYVEHLETYFNVRLLQRNTRKVSLTTAGEQALKHCDEILQQQQALMSLSDDRKIQGRIRITISHFLLKIYFQEILMAFSQQYPDVKFDLNVTEQIVDVYDERVDVAFRVSSTFAEGLIAYPLSKIESVFCATPHYLMQTTIPKTPAELNQHRCIVHQAVGKNATWMLSKEDEANNYVIRDQYTANDVMVLYDLCLAHQGIAMLPTVLVEQDIKENRLLSVLSEYHAPSYELCMVYSSRRHLPTALQLFMKFLKQHF